jgi:poly(A) RNA polymerase GLD2
VDNPASIRNTHLLFYYSKMDYRVRPLVMAVKTWAKKHGINEAKNQTLSSFALTIMVISFLQIGVSPKVVPCLQEKYPHVFHADSDIFSLDYNVPLQFCSDNKQSLGDLLAGFFNHYVFDFDPNRLKLELKRTVQVNGRQDFCWRNHSQEPMWVELCAMIGSMK